MVTVYTVVSKEFHFQNVSEHTKKQNWPLQISPTYLDKALDTGS